MQQRRITSLWENIDLYLLLVAVATMAHVNPDNLSHEPPYLSLASLSYLLLLYVGYKFGPRWGAVAGAVSAGFWFVLSLSVTASPELHWWSAASFDGELMGEDSIFGGTLITYASLQYVVVFAAVGYLSGWAMDVLEGYLHQRGMTLEDLLPRQHLLYLHHLGEWVVRVVRAVFLYQVETEDKKAVILGRIRKLFVVVVAVPLLFAFSASGLRGEIRVAEQFSILLAPIGPVLVLWIAYRMGPRQGVLAALALLLMPASYWYLKTAGVFAELNIRAGFGMSYPGSAIALAIMAWVLGNLGRHVADPACREMLWPSDGVPLARPRLKMWHMLLLVVLATELHYSSDSFSLYWDNYGVLIAAAILSSVLFDVRQVSNTFLLVLGAATLFHLWVPLYDYHVSLDFGRVQVHEVVFLALIPVLAANFRVTRLTEARMLSVLVFGLAWLTDMVTSAGTYDVFPDMSLRLYQAHVADPLLSVVATLLLVELTARGLWALVARRPTAPAVEGMAGDKA